MMKRWDVLPILLVGIGLIALLAAGYLAPRQPSLPEAHTSDEYAAFGTPVPIPPLPDLKPESVALGAQVYAQHCASCHGVNLQGQPNWKKPLADGTFLAPPHDDGGHTWHHPDHLLYTIILDGGNGNPGAKSTMPAFREKLSGQQVAAVVDFFKSRWTAQNRQFQWEATMTQH
jgi:mono/diheme cytochrome c family protein